MINQPSINTYFARHTVMQSLIIFMSLVSLPGHMKGTFPKHFRLKTKKKTVWPHIRFQSKSASRGQNKFKKSYLPIELEYEPHRDKTNKMVCAPSEDSDQSGHPPSLIRVFAVLMKKAKALSYPLCAQRRLWSDWADAQADLSLRWAHMPFC